MTKIWQKMEKSLIRLLKTRSITKCNINQSSDRIFKISQHLWCAPLWKIITNGQKMKKYIYLFLQYFWHRPIQNVVAPQIPYPIEITWFVILVTVRHDYCLSKNWLCRNSQIIFLNWPSTFHILGRIFQSIYTAGTWNDPCRKVHQWWVYMFWWHLKN